MPGNRPQPDPVNRALNVMRAAAAIAVCVGHVRRYLLVPLEGNDFGPVTQLLYALTSLGYGAVMVFFVLSGYFVGGSVIRSHARGSFRWSSYLTARTLRLWLVLVPALILTAILDRIGRHAYPDSDMYGEGARAVANSGVLDFLGNALFLQTQVVPVYGSNGPLWSLGYEFAYYLLFPLILVGVLGARSGRRRFWAAAATLAVAAIGGPLVVALFVTWLLGAAIAWKEPRLRAFVKGLGGKLNAVRLATVVALVGAMLVNKILGAAVERITVATYATAFCAAALIVLYLPDAHPRRRWADSALGASRHLAESSYSLYAYHLPVLALLSTVLSPSGPAFTGWVDPTLAGWAFVTAVTLLLIAGGWVFARGTEHYYKPLRSRAIERIEARRGPP